MTITEQGLKPKNQDLTLADKARQLDLLRKIEYVCASYDFEDVAAVAACMLVSACMQVAGTKMRSLEHLDKTYMRMADIIESNYVAIRKDIASVLS